jgi:NitT/TauT family transport system substrate-binding protein
LPACVAGSATQTHKRKFFGARAGDGIVAPIGRLRETDEAAADGVRSGAGTMSGTIWTRRQAMRLAGGALAGAGGLVQLGAQAQGRAVVNLQLGWLLSGNQLGEACAKQLGYYEQEGIDLRFQARGPSIDGVAIVASGRFEVGQVSSSPSLMLAVSQDIPIRCFAVGAQQHPYTFFSLKKNPVRAPKDLVGKKVGIQATGVILLRALLAENKIAESDVKIITMGADMSPLMTGQVDVVTGWLTNTTALNVIGDQRVDMRLWDSGVRLYALPYYATVQTLKTKADVLARFVRATGKGWQFAYDNREKAVDLLIKEFPNLDRKDELAAADVMLGFVFNANTKANGWGAMDAQIWKGQIEQYAALGQFSKRVPSVDEVMTLQVLEATAAGRPHIG